MRERCHTRHVPVVEPSARVANARLACSPATSVALPMVVALLLGAGCIDAPATLDDATCPPAGTALRYDTFAQPFFAANCNRCHSSASHGAPEAYRFDTLDDIRAHAARIYVRAAGPNVTMPPGPDDPPAADRDQLAEWLACGMP